MPKLSLYAHDGDSDEFKRVSGIWAKGPLEFHRQALEFDVWNLGDEKFAFTEGRQHLGSHPTRLLNFDEQPWGTSASGVSVGYGRVWPCVGVRFNMRRRVNTTSPTARWLAISAVTSRSSW